MRISILVFAIVSLVLTSFGVADIETVTQTVTIPLEAIKPSTEVIPAKSIEIGIRKSEEVKTKPEGCKDLCGDGVCQQIVCLAIGCPCPETKETCAVDCIGESVEVLPAVALPTEVCVKISPMDKKPIKIEEREVAFEGVEKVPAISLEVKPSIFTELPPKAVPIMGSSVNVKVEVNEKQKIASIEVDGVTAITRETLKFENKSLKIETPQNDLVVNIMPNVAKEIVITKYPQTVKEIELKVLEERPVYEIEGVKEAKLLWLFPVLIPVRTEIDAGSGKTIEVEKPWWSFLAW